MKELKTLKEIEIMLADWAEQTGHTVDGCRMKIEQKEEAIKWIKELKKDYPQSVSPMLMVGKNKVTQLKFTIEWIKHFFNITEEDLR